MSAAKDQIIALIPKLSLSEVAQIKAALNFVSGVKEAADQPDLESDWVLSGIIAYLSKRGVISESGAYQQITRSKYYQTYLHKLPDLICYLTRIEQQVSTTARHRPKLAFLCAKALGDYLENQGIFSVSTTLSQIDKIPAAIEAAFPGYGRAGLFRFVLGQQKGKEL